jgi:hypothetical protein
VSCIVSLSLSVSLSEVVTTFSTKGFKGTPYGRATCPGSAELRD